MKYDKDGSEQWSTPLWGAATVTSMVADADGTLYVVGSFSDEVNVVSSNGATLSMKSEDVASAFVGKVNKDGGFDQIKSFTPYPDLDLLETGMYYPEGLYLTPNVVKLNGDKLYIAASYNANVSELGWKAAYLNVYDVMYMENRSKGIFTVNKSDLSGAASVLTVQSTERISYNQVYPEALNFDFDDKGNVCFAFVGFGDLTLATPDASKNFTFETTDDESGMKEHALVGGAINGTEIKATVFHAGKNAGESIPYSIDGMYTKDGVIYLAGTTYGSFWFDVSISYDYTYAFVAAINMSTSLSPWAYTTSRGEEGVKATVMLLTGEELHLGTTAGSFNVNTATGEMVADDEGEEVTDAIINAAAAWEDDYAVVVFVNENSVFVVSKDLSKDDTAVEDIDASVDDDDVPAFDLLGQPIGPDYKGFAITKSGKKVYVK